MERLSDATMLTSIAELSSGLLEQEHHNHVRGMQSTLASHAPRDSGILDTIAGSEDLEGFCGNPLGTRVSKMTDEPSGPPPELNSFDEMPVETSHEWSMPPATAALVRGRGMRLLWARAFRSTDVDGDGYVSAHDVTAKIMDAFGVEVPADDVTAMLANEFSLVLDGSCGFEAFCDAMNQIISRITPRRAGHFSIAHKRRGVWRSDGCGRLHRKPAYHRNTAR